MNLRVCLKCKRLMWAQSDPRSATDISGAIDYFDSGCITERHSVSCRLITDDDKW